jgi:hypothetical protein
MHLGRFAKRMICGLACASGAWAASAGAPASAAPLNLAADGIARSTIYATPAVLARDKDTAGLKTPEVEAENQRRRLRESVTDLATYLGFMSGTRIEVEAAGEPPPPAAAGAAAPVQILVGDLATQAFGPAAKPYPFRQGFRLVVDAKASRVGLIGESDLAVSYAVYEVLDRLGCRWFMPGPSGEVIPQSKTVALEETDFSSHPGTIYRGIWYADDAYRRRNRMGGLTLNAGHALELNGVYLTEQDKQQHAEWVATIGGKPNPARLKWSNAELADFIGDKIIAMHEADPKPSYSLGPDDGMHFDDSPEDRALDAGDFDTTFNTVSITDRLLVFSNRIIDRVTARHPDVLFGCLAYVQYTRPPVREKVHPNFVPQIAPITYSRAHPMNDDRVPDNKELRHIVEGWGKAAPRTSHYFYGWFLAEPVAPNPMIRKWGHDVPYVLGAGNCKFWTPETTANFDTSMHALYLGNRLAWDPSLKPDDVVREINEKFYGAAAKEMAAYWDYVDRAWVETDEYSGGAWGHLRRWTPTRLAEMRRLMDAGLAAVQTDGEKYRVRLADESLRLFEDFMSLRYDLAEGRLADLDKRGDAWKTRIVDLGDQYKSSFAFTRVPWTTQTVSGQYFTAFYERTYRDAARIARDCEVLTEEPLREWRYLPDPEKKGEAAGYAAPGFDDAAWKTTDVAAETWSTLGHHGYFGSMWYRADVTLPPADAAAAGKKTYLWLSSTDGTAKVFVNGRHVPYTPPPAPAQDGAPPAPAPGPQEHADGYCQPFSFDVTAALDPGGKNEVAILCTRSAAAFNELGSGGLIGPVIVYREK